MKTSTPKHPADMSMRPHGERCGESEDPGIGAAGVCSTQSDGSSDDGMACVAVASIATICEGEQA